MANTLESYGRLPLAFEPNQGQSESKVRFLSRSAGQLLLLKQQEAVLLLKNGPATAAITEKKSELPSELRIQFIGANPAADILAMDEQLGKSNYLIGKVDEKWVRNIPNYSRVQYRSLYPGVDLLFYGNRGHLEHDFIIAPGADYRRIVLELKAGGRIRVAKDGSVTIAAGAGDVRFSAPIIYQVRDRQRIEVAGGFRLTGHRLSFRVGSYDKSSPLIIDPVLSYSTYLAGSQGELGTGIVVDSQGDAYVTGLTFSTDFPTKNSLQSMCSSCSPDVFVTKLNSTGTDVIYSTFVGGSAYDQPSSIAIDSAGDAIVGGSTSSTDFPMKNPIPINFGGNNTEGFIFSLSPDGTSLKFSTYLGGTGGASVSTVTTDVAGNIYAAGLTDAADFPIKPASNVIGVPPAYPLDDIFVAKLTADGVLTFATVIGPDPQQQQWNTIFGAASSKGIAVDADQNIYIAGRASQGFPVTPGALQTTYVGPQPYCGTCTMGFVAKLKADGSAFDYATYIGGTGGDQVSGLAIDSNRNVYVAGNTSSSDFPTTAGAFQATFPSGQQGPQCCESFVSKLNSTGTALLFSTFLGGATNYGNNYGANTTGLAINALGESYITGITTSSNFPLLNPLQTTIPQGMFGTSPTTFVTKLNSAGSAILFSTLFSGSTSAQASAIALNPADTKSVYVTGTSYDTDLPTTPGAFQTSIVPPPPFTQPSHVFVTKFDLATPSAAVCMSQNSLFFYTSVNTDSYPDPLTLTNCGNATLIISNIAISGSSFKETDNCKSISPGASCTINVIFHPTARGSFPGTLTISDNAPIQPLKISLQGQGVAPVVQLNTNLFKLDDQLVGQTGLPSAIFVFNVGDDLLNISSVSVAGKDFSADASNCTAPVQPQSICLIFVTFHPVAAGARTATLIINDNALDSPQSVTLQGNGLTAYLQPTISSVSPNAVLENLDNQTIYVFGSGFFQASRIRINGVQIATVYNGESYLQAAIPLNFLKGLGNLKIDVFTPAPGGGLSNYNNVLVYQDLALSANDLIFEPFTRRIYASISPNAASNPNTIVSIDPESEILGNYIPIGNGPNRLGLSDDGKFLYVGLDSDHAVQQFNTTTAKLGSLVSLPNDPYGNYLTAREIHVVPGQPEEYVASLSQYGYPAGVSLVSKGVQLSALLSSTNQNVGVDSICFLSDPTKFYGSNGYQLVQFGITNNSSLQVNASLPGLSELGAQFVCDAKHLYDYSGLVYDPVANQPVGIYHYPPASFGLSVLPDSSVGQTYILTYGTTGFLVFNQKTFAQVGSVTLPQNIFEPYRLLRWGSDGFAFLNFNFSGTGNDIILLRSGLAQPPSGPNPKPKIKKLGPQVRENNGNFQLIVEGSDFVPGAVVRWNNSNRTTIFQSSSTLIADIPNSDLASPGIADITVFNPPKGGGLSNEMDYRIPEEALVSIAITPANPAILKGAKQQFTAIGSYSDGTTRDLTATLKWTSMAAKVATITSAGLATGLSTGTSTIQATSGGVSTSTALTVYVGDRPAGF